MNTYLKEALDAVQEINETILETDPTSLALLSISTDGDSGFAVDLMGIHLINQEMEDRQTIDIHENYEPMDEYLLRMMRKANREINSSINTVSEYILHR